MIRAALFLALAATAAASPNMIMEPLGFSVWHEDHMDWMGVHVDTPPQSVPEASPTLVLAAAGAALILRRNGGAK